MSRVLIAGLPDRLAAWLAQRLSGALVEVTYTGDDALDALLEGSWQLLVLDTAVDGLAADTLVRRIRANARLRALPIIVATDGGEQGTGEDTLRVWVEELGADRILLHPVDRGELARHAAALLESAPKMPAPPSPAPAPTAPPTPGSPPAAGGREAVNAAMAAVWARSRETVMGRIAAVEHGISGLLVGNLTADVRRAAEREAHKLAGALGTFGSHEGSRLARQLEFAFSGASQLTRADGARLSGLAATLRREVEALGGGAPAADSAAPTAAPAPATPAPAAPAPAPAPAPTPPAPQPPSATPTTGAGAGPLLLVLGDDAARARALEGEARGRGMRIRAAGLGEGAPPLAEERPAAVLLDLSGHDEGDGGWALLSELGTRFPAVPVLVTAGRDTLLDRVRALQLGARVFLESTLSPAETLDAVGRTLPAGEQGGRRRRLLAVDDDTAVLEALRAMLEPQGLEVHTLDSPLRFWSTLRDVAPDVLVLDVDMPHLNGIELCRVVRGDHRWSALPVLFLTAHTDPETILRVFAAGADDYATKPVVGPELSARIRVRLERR